MPSPSNTVDSFPRLQKVLAFHGLGSRRQCEELILDGRVEVDRAVVTQLGTRVDPVQQSIRVDGVSLKKRRRRYFVVHKPPGVLSTSNDQWGRARVIDLVAARERLFTVGRLDKESSGLILVTNDGDLANRLTHPRFRVPKTYRVTVAGVPAADVIQKLRRGVVLSDGRVQPESVVVKKRAKQSAVLEVVLTEGRNREIRRMLARNNHKVLKLHRIALGPVRLGMLPQGTYRELTPEEIRKLVKFRPEARSAGKRTQQKRKRPAGTADAPTRSTRSKSHPKTKMGAVIGGSSPPSKHGVRPAEKGQRRPPRKRKR